MKKILALSLLFTVAFTGFSQDSTAVISSNSPENAPIKPLKFNLNADGTQSVAIGVWSQVWLRSMEMNPGTAVNGIAQERVEDVAIRRFRITGTFNLTDRYTIFMHIGMNNQAFNSGGGAGTGSDGVGKKAKIFFHDIYNEYLFHRYDDSAKVPFSLSAGFGLHAWNGISRLSNISTNKMLTLDIPVYNYPGIEISDQMGRQFGMFVHGELGRLGYRMHMNKPFTAQLQPTSSTAAVDRNGHNEWAYGGYYYYQFAEREGQGSAFLAGSYLGEKSIFNIGGGFYSTQKATATLAENGDYTYHPIRVLAADVFYEKPVGDPAKKMAMSLYSVFYNYDLGPNYLRNTGLLNPGSALDGFAGDVAAEGFGNNRFFFGTGNIWHTTAAYILPRFNQSTVRLQPYVTYAMKDLDAVKNVGHFYDLGANILLKDHNAKLSVQYAARPLNNASDWSSMGHAGEWMACLQLYL